MFIFNIILNFQRGTIILDTDWLMNTSIWTRMGDNIESGPHSITLRRTIFAWKHTFLGLFVQENIPFVGSFLYEAYIPFIGQFEFGNFISSMEPFEKLTNPLAVFLILAQDYKDGNISSDVSGLEAAFPPLNHTFVISWKGVVETSILHL